MKRIFIILSFILISIFVVEAKFWTKKELLNAGFKFGIKPHYSEVIYGKKFDGKLNGIVWLKSSSEIILGYMVNGEIAAPYIEIPISDKYNFTGIQESKVSYAADRRDPMSFIVDEIYGTNSSSETFRNRLKNGNYNISHIVTSFDDFISSGQKIPKNAWEEYVEYISDIKITNSFPEEKVPKFSNNLSYPETIKCDGIYRLDYSNNNGGMYINLPSQFDLRHFTVNLDFKPTDKNRTGIIFSLSRRLEIFIKDGVIEAHGKYYHDLIWNTKCPVKIGYWNHISIICLNNTLIITVNNCSRLASFEIPRADLSDSYLTSYNFSTGDNFKGLIKNIKITY